jgi:hypothetical protein
VIFFSVQKSWNLLGAWDVDKKRPGTSFFLIEEITLIGSNPPPGHFLSRRDDSLHEIQGTSAGCSSKYLHNSY